MTANQPGVLPGAAAVQTAAHLAELDTQYDAHVAAVREHAEDAQTAVERGADELAERVEPDPQRP